MNIYKKFTVGVFGIAAFFGSAHATMVNVGGHLVNDAEFADGVIETSGSIYNYDVSGTGVTTNDEAIGGSVGDGISCATDGCSFSIWFSNGVENQSGNDIAIFGLASSGSELFDIELNGIRMSDMWLTGTGFDESGFEISFLEIDLSYFGIADNDVVNHIEIIVNGGVNAEEFSIFANLNDVPVPLPAAVWLFGSVLAFGGIAGRRKRAMKAAKS